MYFCILINLDVGQWKATAFGKQIMHVRVVPSRPRAVSITGLYSVCIRVTRVRFLHGPPFLEGNMTSEKFAARLVLYNPADFSPDGAKDIAAWLRKLAKTVLKEHKDMSKQFTAKYYYP